MDKLVLGLLLLCIVLSYIESTNNEYLEYSSSILIQKIQESDHAVIKQIFFLLDWVTSICFLVLSGIIYIKVNRDDGLVCMIAAYSGAACSGVLKSLFAHPRPLWKYEQIEAITCPKDWGSPSGHSMAAGTPLIMMLLLLNQRRSPSSHKFFIIACIIIVASTRLYIGAHFHFQVILGLSFSALIASVLNFLYFSGRLKFTDLNFIYKTSILLVFLLVFSYAVNISQEPNWKKFWEVNFKAKCPGGINEEKAQNKALLDSLLWANVLGLAVGRFCLGKFEGYFRWNWLAGLVSWGAIWAFVQVDGYVKTSLVLVVMTRFLEGVFFTYFIPKLSDLLGILINNIINI